MHQKQGATRANRWSGTFENENRAGKGMIPGARMEGLATYHGLAVTRKFAIITTGYIVFFAALSCAIVTTPCAGTDVVVARNAKTGNGPV